MLQTQDESRVPLTINCWPSSSGADSYVNIEYESTVDFDLHHVAISIPVPSASSAPRINQVCSRLLMATDSSSRVSEFVCVLGMPAMQVPRLDRRGSRRSCWVCEAAVHARGRTQRVGKAFCAQMPGPQVSVWC